MHGEIDSFTHRYPYFEQPATEVGADQHRQAVEVEDSDGVAKAWSMSSSGIPCFRALARTTGSTATSYLDVMDRVAESVPTPLDSSNDASTRR